MLLPASFLRAFRTEVVYLSAFVVLVSVILIVELFFEGCCLWAGMGCSHWKLPASSMKFQARVKTIEHGYPVDHVLGK